MFFCVYNWNITRPQRENLAILQHPRCWSLVMIVSMVQIWWIHHPQPSQPVPNTGWSSTGKSLNSGCFWMSPLLRRVWINVTRRVKSPPADDLGYLPMVHVRQVNLCWSRRSDFVGKPSPSHRPIFCLLLCLPFPVMVVVYGIVIATKALHLWKLP